MTKVPTIAEKIEETRNDPKYQNALQAFEREFLTKDVEEQQFFLQNFMGMIAEMTSTMEKAVRALMIADAYLKSDIEDKAPKSEMCLDTAREYFRLALDKEVVLAEFALVEREIDAWLPQPQETAASWVERAGFFSESFTTNSPSQPVRSI